MESIFIIEETILYLSGNREITQVCGALNEEEAKHKVKYLNEHATISNNFIGAELSYNYKELSLFTAGSWLVDVRT